MCVCVCVHERERERERERTVEHIVHECYNHQRLLNTTPKMAQASNDHELREQLEDTSGSMERIRCSSRQRCGWGTPQT